MVSSVNLVPGFPGIAAIIWAFFQLCPFMCCECLYVINHNMYRLGIIVDVARLAQALCIIVGIKMPFVPLSCLLCSGMHLLQKSTSFLVICFHCNFCVRYDMVVITVSIGLW